MEWPAGLKARPLGPWLYPVTARRQRSQFSAPLRSTAELLTRELRELQARDVVLRLDVAEWEIRRDGAPYTRANPSTPAIVLQFDTPTGPLAFPCDRFTTWQDNLRAVSLSLEALRRVDRYGVTMQAEQYAGFRAIEAPRAEPFTSRTGAREFLRSLVGDLLDPFTAGGATDEQLARAAMRATHPDTGGNAAEFARVTEAADYLKRNPAP